MCDDFRDNIIYLSQNVELRIEIIKYAIKKHSISLTLGIILHVSDNINMWCYLGVMVK